LGCYDGRLNVLTEPYKLRSDLDGFRQMTDTVEPLLTSGRFRQAILGHEFTGVYHEPWSWQIHEHYAPHLAGQTSCPLTYHLLNPLLTKKRREDNSIRQRSTDRLAVRAIASCLADGLGHPAHRLTAAEAQLDQLVRAYYHLQRQQRHLARQLIPLVDRLWPGAIVDLAKFRAAHPELEPPTPIVKTQALKPVLRQEAEQQAAARKRLDKRSTAKGREGEPLNTDGEEFYQTKLRSLERETILVQLLNQPGEFVRHKTERILLAVADRFEDRRLQAAYERYRLILNERDIRVPMDEDEPWRLFFTYHLDAPSSSAQFK